MAEVKFYAELNPTFWQKVRILLEPRCDECGRIAVRHRSSTRGGSGSYCTICDFRPYGSSGLDYPTGSDFGFKMNKKLKELKKSNP